MYWNKKEFELGWLQMRFRSFLKLVSSKDIFLEDTRRLIKVDSTFLKRFYISFTN